MIFLNQFRRLNRLTCMSSGLQRCRLYSPSSKEIPSNAEIVIAGAGAVGSSVAYHLEKYGCKDILLLEQGQAGCGTSWHAAGLCGSLKGKKSVTEIVLYGLDLYSKFEQQGVSVGFKQCGSLDFATTKDRAISLKRSAALSKECGVECYVIGPKEAAELNPLLNTDEIEIAVWSPNDGLLNPTDLIQAYIKSARKSGNMKFIEGVSVESVHSDKNRITGVSTNHGFVSCDTFISCTGLWARELGLRSDPIVKIPLHACEHFLIITKALENINPMLPVTRDFDGHTYLREWSGGLLGGGFEPNARGTFYKGIPENFQFQLLEEDWEHFGLTMDSLLHRYPCFDKAEIRHFTNGPESFTPDGLPYLSASTVFSNYYVAAGQNSTGIVSSAGVGRAMAELITNGESFTNIHMFDMRRIPPSANNKLYCYDKAPMSLTAMYSQRYPEMTCQKSVMNSPIHCLLENKGAVWGEIGDWATPLYFKMADDEKHVDSFGQPCWLPNVQSELKACDESVGFVDLSPKSKFSVTFPNEQRLDEFIEQSCFYLRGKQIKPKDTKETILLNSKSSLTSTLDISKLNEINITMITEPNQHGFLSSELESYIGEQSTKGVVEDITGKYAMFGLIGPRAEKVLSELLPPPFKTTDVEKGESHTVDLGYASNVQLSNHFMRGVDGWKIMVPVQYSQRLYSMIVEVGDKHGLKNIGRFALNSLRVRNMIPSFGSELDSRTDKLILDDLYGTDEKQSSISLMKVEISLPDSENWPWGGEFVVMEGQTVGQISSVGYTNEDNKILGLSLLDRRHIKLNQKVSIVTGGDIYKGKVVGIL